jgi:hypothetical protein
MKYFFCYTKTCMHRATLLLLFITFVTSNLPIHDWHDFSVRVQPNKEILTQITSLSRNARQNIAIRSMMEELRTRIVQNIIKRTGLRDINSNTDTWDLSLKNEKQIGVLRVLIAKEQKQLAKEHNLEDILQHEQMYNIVETYKESEGYKNYMRQQQPTTIAYKNYVQLTAFLQEMNSKYPEITSVFSVGKSNQNRDLWGIKISVPQKPNALLPKAKFKYVGNIHGDETVGRVILTQFIETLLEQYNNGSARIHRLLDTTDMYIVPSMNPDGFEMARRENSNGQDLNRDFPDQFVTSMTGGTQPETRAMMQWFQQNTFHLSANFHGGAVVASYPYDGLPSGQYSMGVYSRSPDDALYVMLSKTYANNHKSMTGPSNPEFPSGITNGAEWYTLYGGMQDYNLKLGTPEITVELSNIKYPPAQQLAGFWQDNKDALLAYAESIYKAVGGVIFDYNTGNPVNSPCTVTFSSTSKELDPNGKYNTTIAVNPRDKGFYYRVLVPASYDMSVKCDGYRELTTKSVNVVDGATKPVALNWMVSSQANTNSPYWTSGSYAITPTIICMVIYMFVTIFII